MHVDQAREIAKSIEAAVAAAEQAGQTDVDLADVMKAAAHNSRDELAAAIAAAEKKQG